MIIIRQCICGMLLVTALLAIANTSAYSQILISGNDRPLLVGARAIALADAYTADISDVSVLYWNPAALSFVENRSVMYDHYSEIKTATNNEIIALPITGFREGSLAVGATVSHVGYLNTAVDNYRGIDYGIDIGYSRMITSGWSMGVKMRGEYGHSDNSNVFSNSWTFGMIYHPSSEITYGLVYSGVGDGLLMATPKIMEREQLPHRLEFGVTMCYPSARKHRFLTIALANQKIFGTDGMYYKAGIELLPMKILALRVGYAIDPSSVSARFGVGIIKDGFRLDYAMSPSAQILRFQQITLAINI